nr:unnamed protein product [Callosobruchus chinensis]
MHGHITNGLNEQNIFSSTQQLTGNIRYPNLSDLAHTIWQWCEAEITSPVEEHYPGCSAIIREALERRDTPHLSTDSV